MPKDLGVLPSPFVLKVHNGKYLRRMGQDVQAHDDQKGAEYGFWEPFFKLPRVAIRGVSGHYFWRYNRDWIKVDAYYDENNPDIWFRVVQVSPTQIGLYCISNKSYLYPLTADSRTDTLNASSSRLHEDDKTVYTVEPAILHRRIENVEYDFSRKKETQGKPVAAGKVEVYHNGKKVALTINRSVSFTVAREKSWNTSSTFTESVEMSVETPEFAGIGLGFTASSTKTEVNATGKSHAEAVKDEAAVSITAQPQHKTTAHFILSRAQLSLPYTYDETIQNFDGSSKKEHKTDGVFEAKEGGVMADWTIVVEKFKEEEEEGMIAEVIEDGEKVAEAGVELAGTTAKTGINIASDVNKAGIGITGKAATGVLSGIGGVFGGHK